MTTLIHIEDDPLWAHHVRELLAAWPEFRLLGTAATGECGLAHCRAQQPNIVLLDLRLPDLEAPAIIDRLGALRPSLRVVLLTSCAGDGALALAEKKAIAGLVWKTGKIASELRDALAAVACGARYYSPEAQQALRRFHSTPDSYIKLLTARELEALPHFVRGSTDHEVASALGCAAATAHSHRKNIMLKLDLHSLAGLQEWALRNDVFYIPRPAPPCAAPWVDR